MWIKTPIEPVEDVVDVADEDVDFTTPIWINLAQAKCIHDTGDSMKIVGIFQIGPISVSAPEQVASIRKYLESNAAAA